MRWKARTDALQDRIETNVSYLNVLTEVEMKMKSKSEAYKKRVEKGEELMRDF